MALLLLWPSSSAGGLLATPQLRKQGSACLQACSAAAAALIDTLTLLVPPLMQAKPCWHQRPGRSPAAGVHLPGHLQRQHHPAGGRRSTHSVSARMPPDQAAAANVSSHLPGPHPAAAADASLRAAVCLVYQIGCYSSPAAAIRKTMVSVHTIHTDMLVLHFSLHDTMGWQVAWTHASSFCLQVLQGARCRHVRLLPLQCCPGRG